MADKYVYSIDGEYYVNEFYNSEKEAIEAAKEQNTGIEEVYVGIAAVPDLRWESYEDYILDSMNEYLREDCDEAAEGFREGVTKEQEIDLGEMIDETVKQWIEKHGIKPNCYTVVECGLHELN